jgi:hypothetical protein
VERQTLPDAERSGPGFDRRLIPIRTDNVNAEARPEGADPVRRLE